MILVLMIVSNIFLVSEVKRKNVDGLLEPTRAQNIGMVYNVFKLAMQLLC